MADDRVAGMIEPPLLSICIPSYNRPELLKRLLESVDVDTSLIDIVICEDKAPRREEVRAVVADFRENHGYRVSYFENEKNFGYDRNLRELIVRCSGKFLMYMGDDDQFTPGKLSEFLAFLQKNEDVGYILRNRLVRHDDGTIEPFSYFPSSRRFEPGMEAYVLLYRKTVTISGVTFRRDLCLDLLTDRFDGALLFQCYLVAEIALHHPTVYCDVPVVTPTQTYRLDKPNFGAAEVEQGLYEPGKITIRNSVNFMKGFLQITRYMDEKYGFQSTTLVRDDISRYSYPVLSIQRKRGAREFLRYMSLLNREVGINTTIYYYIYGAGLLVFGEAFCDKLIIYLKKALGRTPAL